MGSKSLSDERSEDIENATGIDVGESAILYGNDNYEDSGLMFVDPGASLIQWTLDKDTADIPDSPTIGPPPAPQDNSRMYEISTQNQQFLNGIAQQQLGIAQQVQDNATEEYERWKTTLQPLELDILKKTKIGIDPNIHTARVRNAIMSKYGGNLRNTQNALASRGIKAGGIQSTAVSKKLQSGTANAIGKAQQSERERIENINRSNKAQVAGLGSGISNTVANGLASASSTMGGAATTANRGSSAMLSALNNVSNQRYANEMQLYNLENQEAMNDYNYDVATAEAEAAASNGMKDSVVSVVGAVVGGLF